MLLKLDFDDGIASATQDAFFAIRVQGRTTAEAGWDASFTALSSIFGPTPLAWVDVGS